MTASYLEELDNAILSGSAESRERALWHATDLLMVGRFTDEEIWVFGEIIGRRRPRSSSPHVRSWLRSSPASTMRPHR